MRKIVQRRIRRSGRGINLVADVNAVIATNTSKAGGRTATSSCQSLRVHQSDGHAEVIEERSEG